jgi:hypothetical protein
MGTTVSSLDKLPVHPGIDMYIFIVNAYGWEGSIGKKIDEEFRRIAENIAKNAMVVSPLRDPEIFATSLRDQIKAQIKKDRGTYRVRQVASMKNASLKEREEAFKSGKLPKIPVQSDRTVFLERIRILGEMVSGGGGLIILGAHPNQLTMDDFVLAIPMRGIKSNYERVEDFLTELCEFTKGNNPGFAEKFDEIDDKLKHSALELLEYVELKPGIFGLSLNLNAIFQSILGKKAGATA